MPQFMGNKVKIPIYIRKELWDRLENYVQNMKNQFPDMQSNEFGRNMVIKTAIELYLDYAEEQTKPQKVIQKAYSGLFS
ncbi:MAG TPA: hypothetical protein VEP90_28420 [Methylomirabilota bacterium]|nr:hypothetical protein [Methylomirabilota bacterium]